MLKNVRMVKIWVAATAVVVLGSGAPAAASTSHLSAQHPRGHRHHVPDHDGVAPAGAFGTVASVNGSAGTTSCGSAGDSGAFTVTARKSTTDTVDVSTSTTFVAPGTATASFADVCVGDLVGALGTVSGDTVTATKVYVTPTEGTLPQVHRASGKWAPGNASGTAGAMRSGFSGETSPPPHGVFGTGTAPHGVFGTGTAPHGVFGTETAPHGSNTTGLAGGFPGGGGVPAGSMPGSGAGPRGPGGGFSSGPGR